MILAIAYFLFVTIGAGFALWKLLSLKEEDGFVAIFMYLALGLVVFVSATSVLGFFYLSNWLSYVILTVVLLSLTVWQGKLKFTMPKISKEWVLILIILFAHLAVYLSGALGYKWLEDDDPWEHAGAVRYVSLFNTFIQPSNFPYHYLAPYSPYYDVLMGTIFQLNSSSLQGTLKIFNALLVSLSIPFFYCWAKERFDKRTSLWATFILAIIPSFMSHFIWAQTLAVLLVFPALYFFEKYMKSEEKDEKRGFLIAGALSIASALICQGSSAAMFGGLMAAYFVGVLVSNFISNSKIDMDKAKKMATILGLGILLALAEFWVPMIIVFSLDRVVASFALGGGTILLGRYSDTGGGIIYSLTDFITAPFSSKMDQPTGFGIFLFLLMLIGIWACIKKGFLEKAKEETHIVLLGMLIYTFIGTMGYALPIHIVPHRFWVFLAIPIAVLGAIGTGTILEYFEKNMQGTLKLAAVIIVLGLLWSSAYPKYIVETSQWPPGVSWVSQDQLNGYIGLLSLPPNTKVFSFCNNEIFVNGFDMYGNSWTKEILDYKNQSITDSNDGNYALLKKYGYDYAIIDQSCVSTTSNNTNAILAKLNLLSADSRFTLVKGLSNQAFLTFKVN